MMHLIYFCKAQSKRLLQYDFNYLHLVYIRQWEGIGGAYWIIQLELLRHYALTMLMYHLSMIACNKYLNDCRHVICFRSSCCRMDTTLDQVQAPLLELFSSAVSVSNNSRLIMAINMLKDELQEILMQSISVENKLKYLAVTMLCTYRC
jgi:hypothetical protein